MATGPIKRKLATPHAALPHHPGVLPTRSPLLVSTNTVCFLVCLSRAQIYKLVKRGEFPAPVKISAQKVAYVLAEVEAWLGERTNARDVAA
jgi:prophage regulatory protein